MEETQTKKEQTISLKNITDSTVRSLTYALKENGWAFVLIPDALTAQLAELTPLLEAFFASPNNVKEQYCERLVKDSTDLDGSVYGYNRADTRKEGLRLLTGSRLRDRWLPPECRTQLRNLSHSMDDLLRTVCLSLSPALFTPESLANIPLLNDKAVVDEKLDAPGSGWFGMLDVARYYNETLPANGLNCASHYDPGLLSLSVLSTQPGLQVQRSTGEWVDGPVGLEGVALLWAGELAVKASGGRAKAGVHRVTFPATKGSPPRMSVWLECVSQMQDLSLSGPLLAKAKAPKDMEITLPSAFQPGPRPGNKNNKAAKPATTAFPGFGGGRKMGAKRDPRLKLHIREGQSLEQALREASADMGMPMTKMITYYCPLCGMSQRDLLSHFNDKHPNDAEHVPAGYESGDDNVRR